MCGGYHIDGRCLHFSRRFLGWRNGSGNANADTDRNADGYTDRKSNSYTDGHTNRYANSYTDSRRWI